MTEAKKDIKDILRHALEQKKHELSDLASQNMILSTYMAAKHLDIQFAEQAIKNCESQVQTNRQRIELLQKEIKIVEDDIKDKS
jgi:hypothetical protein